LSQERRFRKTTSSLNSQCVIELLDCFPEELPDILASLINTIQDKDFLTPITVVTPGFTFLRSLRNWVGREGLFNVKFTTIDRLASEISIDVMDSKGMVPLSSSIRNSMLRKLMSEITGDLEVFKGTQGLRNALNSNFYSFSQLDTDSLKTLSNSNADQLIKTITQLYLKFKNSTKEFYDRTTLFKEATQLLTTDSCQKLSSYGVIIFALPWNYLPNEINFMKAILNTLGGHVILGFVGEEECDQLQNNIAKSLGFEDLISSRRSLQQQVHNNTRFVITTDPTEEIRYVIRSIVDASGKGIPFNKMGIIYEQEFPYRHLIEDELSLAGIPYFNPKGTKLSDTSPGKTLHGILELINSDIPRKDMMEWISECPINLSNPLSSPLEWDHISRVANVVSGLDQWRERLSVLSKTKQTKINDHRSLDEIELTKNSIGEEIDEINYLLEFVVGLANKLSHEKLSTWESFSDWIWNIFTYYLNQTRLSETDLKALALIEDGILELKMLDKINPTSNIDLFQVTVLDFLESTTIQTGRFGTGIFIGPMNSAVGIPFDISFITGLTEGKFPSFGTDDPLLPDNLKEKLGGPSVGLPTRNGRLLIRRYEFLSILLTSKECILSTPKGDMKEQRSVYPSKWFLELVSSRCGSQIKEADLIKLSNYDWFNLIPSKIAGLREAPKLGYTDINEYDLVSFLNWRESGKTFRKHPFLDSSSPVALSLDSNQGRRSNLITVWDGDVSEAISSDNLKEFLRKRPLSASMLEAYSTCPYQFFLRYIIGIQELKTPEDVSSRINPADRGTILHEIFENFHLSVISEGTTPGIGAGWSTQHKNLMKKTAESCFDKWLEDGKVADGIYWELDKEMMLASLEYYLERDSDLRSDYGVSTYRVEQPFGFINSPNNWEGPEINIPQVGNIKFRGYIDRLDKSPDGHNILVIDLKTGSSTPYEEIQKDNFVAGKKLQLPIYLLAVDKNVSDAKNISAAYWMVSFKGNYQVIPSEPLNYIDIKDAFKSILTKITRGISSGLFPANPGIRETNCTFCDYNSICPTDKGFSWNRKSQRDERIAEYLSLDPEKEPEE